ncbi:MAG TPA: amino acid adenylation domain-containing protein, partial [Chitinophagaceae bacterium]|nr:amino acid adenylation domain-containing protein [Chitinophagaceae bacterium]
FKATENYKQLLTHVKQVTLNAHEHQLYPFDELVEQLNLQRDMSRNPLFDVMVSMDAASTNAQQQIGDLHITAYKEETNITSKFDLLFNFAETENEVQLSIEYNNDLFNADTILRMANHVEQLLTNAVAQPTIPLQQLNYLNEKEKHQLTTVFNNTSTQQIHSKTVIALFEEQAQKTPHAVALIFETKKITYKALNEHANRLAHYIQTNYTIKPDDVIGIQLERSEWMIISILAVLKSGGAYVPIDTTYPQERVHYIIENSACKVVINEKEVEKFKKEANKYEPHHVSPVHQYDDLAYIIYTSGSTGTPKGCAITHKSFSNYIQWANNYYATQATKVNFGLYTSLAFDLTITSIFCTLTQGGQLFIYPQQQELSAILQHTFSADSDINYIKLTPSHITVLHQLNITSSNIIVAIVGGEEVTPQHVHILKKINPAIQIYNEYGPTEATVGCVVKQLEENESIQIGKPIAQTAIYILDEDDQLCAIGVIGEICISGDGLARGYLNKPELTKEKFVPNPFKPATKMYKTGDIGRWLADGNIEYIGRKDEQVKIRGY